MNWSSSSCYFRFQFFCLIRFDSGRKVHSSVSMIIIRLISLEFTISANVLMMFKPLDLAYCLLAFLKWGFTLSRFLSSSEKRKKWDLATIAIWITARIHFFYHSCHCSQLIFWNLGTNGLRNCHFFMNLFSRRFGFFCFEKRQFKSGFRFRGLIRWFLISIIGFLIQQICHSKWRNLNFTAEFCGNDGYLVIR